MSDYTAIELGGLDEWGSGGEHPGKRFIDAELGTAHTGISVNSTEPGGESPFWHVHSAIEETHIVLSGRGEIALDDEVLPLGPGTVVRVGPGTWRAVRALPDSGEPMKWLCVRSGPDSLAGVGDDAEIDGEPPFPWNA